MNNLIDNLNKQIFVPKDEFLKLLEIFIASNLKKKLIFSLKVKSCTTHDFLPLEIEHVFEESVNANEINKLISYISSLEITSGILILNFSDRFIFEFKNNTVKLTVENLNNILRAIASYVIKDIDNDIYNFQMEYTTKNKTWSKKISFSKYHNMNKDLFACFLIPFEFEENENTRKQTIENYSLFVNIMENPLCLHLKLFSLTKITYINLTITQL